MCLITTAADANDAADDGILSFSLTHSLTLPHIHN